MATPVLSNDAGVSAHPFRHPALDRCFELIGRARDLAPAEPDLAVLLAQTAVEIYVEVAFDALLAREVKTELVRERMAAFVRDSRSLKGDRRPRDLWEALTGEKISTAPTWKEYDRHVERRNLVVHAGQAVSPQEATASLDACEGMIDHMQQVLHDIFFDD